jgi:hypothetical protein
MRYKPFTLALLYLFFLLTGRVYGIGEKTITLGSSSSWELIEKRYGIAEVSYIRPHPVLTLAGGVSGIREENTDLHLSFDEGQPRNFADSLGHYDVLASAELASAVDPWSRVGKGAALFNGKPGADRSEGPLVLIPRNGALFAPGSYVRDFSIEFWLYPQNLETGAQVLSWYSSKPDGKNGYLNQRIQCVVTRNRLQWTFHDFFFSPGFSAKGSQERKSISLLGSPLLNRTWSHHLIRFDADLGLLEYLVDGRLEALDYTTSSGREGGDVYTPIIGEDCHLALGDRFSGLMDEFRIHRNYLEKAELARYSGRGGRVETRTLDLGYADSRIVKIEAFGGRTSNFSGKVRNEYAGNGALSFSDHSEMKFFIRLSNSPYRWNEVPWIPFDPQADLRQFRGRYIQLAADFYPGADGETSPYLSELKVIYSAAEPPPPPAYVAAVAGDGTVELTWRTSPSRDVGGYYVYYGTAKGEYLETKCPIDAGNRTSILIDGLKNGTLYYFAVAAYNKPELAAAEGNFAMRNEGHIFVPDPGEFSREVAARPLLKTVARMAE